MMALAWTYLPPIWPITFAYSFSAPTATIFRRPGRRWRRAIASPTSSGTCEPPGASRKTKSPCSDENRRLHRLDVE